MDNVVWGPHLLDVTATDPDGLCLAERTGGANLARDWYGWRCAKPKDHWDDCGDWRRLVGLLADDQAGEWNAALNRYATSQRLDNARGESSRTFELDWVVTVPNRNEMIYD